MFHRDRFDLWKECTAQWSGECQAKKQLSIERFTKVKTYKKPQSTTWSGAEIQGILFSKFRLSSWSMTIGGIATKGLLETNLELNLILKVLLIPGKAIKILDMTTCEMATWAIFFELPILFPFSSNTAIPLVSSLFGKLLDEFSVPRIFVQQTLIASWECWYNWQRPLNKILQY